MSAATCRRWVNSAAQPGLGVRSAAMVTPITRCTDDSGVAKGCELVVGLGDERRQRGDRVGLDQQGAQR